MPPKNLVSVLFTLSPTQPLSRFLFSVIPSCVKVTRRYFAKNSKSYPSEDSKEYLSKKKHFQSFHTVFGRKPVLDVLLNSNIHVEKLHINKTLLPKKGDEKKLTGTLKDIIEAAKSKNVPTIFSTKEKISYISKHASQDQGVVCDILPPPGHLLSLDEFIKSQQNNDTVRFRRILALDGITNPENLGLIARCVASASSCIHGILLSKNCPPPTHPLVIKSSSGTIFKTKIIHTQENLFTTLQTLKESLPSSLFSLHPKGHKNLFTMMEEEEDQKLKEKMIVYILGNESKGVSEEVLGLSDELVHIPMDRENGVESLNVAITAALICYKRMLIVDNNNNKKGD